MTAPVLALAGLTKRYGRPGTAPAVADLTLALAPGEIYALLGPNGAGKTTTLKLILGLLTPDAGRIALLGGAIADRKVRARLGYLPEEPVLHPFLTVNDVLGFYGALFGYRGADLRGRVSRIAALVGLADRRTQRLRELSKGLRQRVLLGQALINDPDLIFLDEPQAGLDPVGMQDLRHLMVALKAQGRTILLNSHQLTEVEQVADRIGIIRSGRLVREGATSELLAVEAAWEVTIAGIGLGQAERIAPDGVTVSEREGMFIFRSPSEELAQQVMAAAQGAGGRLAGFAAAETSLEAVFMRLMDPAAGGQDA